MTALHCSSNISGPLEGVDDEGEFSDVIPVKLLDPTHHSVRLNLHSNALRVHSVLYGVVYNVQCTMNCTVLHRTALHSTSILK